MNRMKSLSRKIWCIHFGPVIRPLLVSLVTFAVVWIHGGSTVTIVQPAIGADSRSKADDDTPASFKNTTIPLGEHPQGRQMMAKAAKDAAMVDISFKFLDKTYKDDIYVREPITGKKARVSCRRFRGVSGFDLKIDPPQYKFTDGGLTLTQNISRISAQGLKVKWQLGPCVESVAGIGVKMSDVTFVYKARPMLAFDGNGFCRLTFNSETEKIRVKIGDLNITGVQNDLDKLIKDAFREGLNATFKAMYGKLMGDALAKVTLNMCGSS
jgi:hypothetical protein